MAEAFIEAVVAYTNAQTRRNAEAYLIQFEQNPASFNIATQILQIPSSQLKPESVQLVYYFALKAIESTTKNYQLFNDELRLATAKNLLNWAIKQQPGMALKKAIQTGVNLLLTNPSLTPTLLVQVIILIIRGVSNENECYPTLVLLDEINEALIEKSKAFSTLVPLSNAVKDEFRKDGISVVIQFLFQAMTNQKYTKEALVVFSSYIPWVDISFSTNEAFMRCLFASLQVPALFSTGVNVLQAIVSKGMPGAQKFLLLQKLNINNSIPHNIPPASDEFEKVCNLVGATLSEILVAVEKEFPVKQIVAGKVQITQQQLVMVFQLISGNFVFFLELFSKADLSTTKEFSAVIARIVGDFYGPLLNVLIPPQEVAQLAVLVFQTLFGKYQQLIRNAFESEELTLNELTTALANVYKCATVLDYSKETIKKFLDDLQQYGATDNEGSSVVCHAYFLLQLPDKLLQQKETQVYMGQHVGKYFMNAVPKLLVRSESVILSCVIRYLSFMDTNTVEYIVNNALIVCMQNKHVEAVKDLVFQYKKLGGNGKEDWVINIVKQLLLNEEVLYTQKQLREESDIYEILGVLSEKYMEWVIANVFQVTLTRLNETCRTKSDFCGKYVYKKLENFVEFLRQNRNVNRIEVRGVFEGYKLVVKGVMRGEIYIEQSLLLDVGKKVNEFLQQWVESVSEQSLEIPSPLEMVQYYGRNYEGQKMVVSVMTHIANKQQKMKQRIVTEEYIHVLKMYVENIGDIEQLGVDTELYREKVDEFLMIINLTNLPIHVGDMLNYINWSGYIKGLFCILKTLKNMEMGKMILKHCVRSIEMFVESNGIVGKSFGIFNFVGLFVELVYQTKLSNYFPMGQAIVEGLRGLLTSTKKHPEILNVLKLFIDNITDINKKNWISNFFGNIMTVTPNALSVPVIVNLLKN
ncbi:hypothetical protein EIN_020770 [Entamoeba invadens IP1]|uniref:hypothetical protein n=1 Tax=Entamoeba invadens IP1 TaxID=370355 RepID=UPI0002C3D8D9|nr:hypothetical protein EIN_020770 [Entamoeba invadens IP1]ELP90598.1 hypothetical protein EIN_020770 [Entamoeba invadens IP1]|eukprot:XP_004257369.1 hypothetical protein EIN_020770 [Entamoeba invadens IP1]